MYCREYMRVNNIDMKKYKRFFAFGDSFTKYYWPTYADILALKSNYHENWGLKGAGNHYIFNSVIECIKRKNVCVGDLVVVMWTGELREDRYVDGQWSTAATDYRQTMYGTEWMQKYGTETRGNLIRDLAYIDAVKTVLEHIGCDYCFLSSIPLYDTESDVLELYKDTLDTIHPSLFLQIRDKPNRPNHGDLHPTPYESLDYLVEELGSTITHDEIAHWEQMVQNITIKNTVDFNRVNVTRL